MPVHNLGAVESELTRYITTGTIPVEEMGSVELAEYWKVGYKCLVKLYADIALVLVAPIHLPAIVPDRYGRFTRAGILCFIGARVFIKQDDLYKREEPYLDI